MPYSAPREEQLPHTGPTSHKTRIPTRPPGSRQFHLARLFRSHRQGQLLALARAQPGRQYHRLLCPGPQPDLPRRHGPDYRRTFHPYDDSPVARLKNTKNPTVRCHRGQPAQITRPRRIRRQRGQHLPQSSKVSRTTRAWPFGQPLPRQFSQPAQIPAVPISPKIRSEKSRQQLSDQDHLDPLQSCGQPIEGLRQAALRSSNLKYAYSCLWNKYQSRKWGIHNFPLLPPTGLDTSCHTPILRLHALDFKAMVLRARNRQAISSLSGAFPGPRKHPTPNTLIRQNNPRKAICL